MEFDSPPFTVSQISLIDFSIGKSEFYFPSCLNVIYLKTEGLSCKFIA